MNCPKCEWPMTECLSGLVCKNKRCLACFPKPQNDGGEIATPRTDADLNRFSYLGISRVNNVDAIFARTLERELHQAKLQIAMDTIRLREITELGIKRDIELKNATKKSEIVAELVENLASELNYLYWSAYHSGHHDTVEGQYADVFREDRFTYHEHKVADCLDSGDMQILLKLSRAANL